MPDTRRYALELQPLPMTRVTVSAAIQQQKDDAVTHRSSTGWREATTALLALCA